MACSVEGKLLLLTIYSIVVMRDVNIYNTKTQLLSFDS